MKQTIPIMVRKVANKAIRFSLVGLLVLMHGQLMAQMVVTGKVTSEEDGGSLPGVSILVEGSTKGTVTDLDGNYKIEIPDVNTVLTYSFIGFLKEKVTVAGRSTIDLVLKPDVAQLEEVVVIGYGEQKKREITGAVARVDSEDIMKNATADLGAALQGSIAGVNVQASSGEPGAGSNILIRGLSSINGVNAPLFVVDGIPYNDDPKLSINEIETIDVLKDAASASVYGTRGSGGVILITTKRGKAGVMKLGIDSYMGVQKITSGTPLMDKEQGMYANFVSFYHLNPNQNFQNSWTFLENNPTGFTNNTNLVPVFENDNALIQNHSINVSGGKEGLNYNIVGSFFEQDGSIINSGYKRYNVRANTSYKQRKWTVTTGMGFRVEEQQYAPYQFLLEAIKYDPLQQLLDPDAEIVQDAGNGNQAAALGGLMAKLKQRDNRHGNHFNLTFQAENQLTDDIKLMTRLGTSFEDNTRVRINPLFIAYDDDGELIPATNATRSGVYNYSDKSGKIAWENTAQYSKKFGDHSIRALGLFSMEKYTFDSFFGQKKDLLSNDVVVLNGATADADAGSGNNWGQDRTNSLFGIMGRVQYDYKGRYLLSVSARRDGSSRFSEKFRWGTFPSVSVGWNVSDEAFFSPVKSVADIFKIRASYGTTGNQNFLDYSNSASITIGRDYAFGPETNNTLILGAVQTAYANENVKWETSEQLNVGFDLGFLNNKLTLSGDFYNTEKKDMLFPLLLPQSAGAGKNATVVLNVGNMTNKGMEFTSSYRHNGEVSWSVGGTFAKNVNEITKMSGANDIAYLDGSTVVAGVPNEDLVTAIAEGYPAGAFFLMETDGIIDSVEELEEYNAAIKNVGTAKLGDLKYVDYDGDSLIDSRLDRQFMGSGAPDFEIGVNFDIDYKGFDFSMQWYAAVGGEVMNGSRAYAYKYGRHLDQLYQWSPQNPNSFVPADRGRDHLNHRGYTDYWLEDGTFLRLRNVALGYTLPSSIMEKVGVSKFRIYISAQNPITITDYKGYDPEVGNNGLSTRGLDRGNYPISSTYRMGLQLDF